MTRYSRTVISTTAVITIYWVNIVVIIYSYYCLICSNIIILQNDGKPRVEKKYYAVLAIILQAVGIFIGGISTFFVPQLI